MRFSDEDYSDLIEYSRLPRRLVHILHRHGIERLSHLKKISDGQLLLLKNVGPDYLTSIRTHKT